ncbi:MAG: polysaccharide deacetylase family protein [Chloracidobacterium sp.]|nr:polysaccharide deacetylase family protein [Chloracidobacterium sp.]
MYQMGRASVVRPKYLFLFLLSLAMSAAAAAQPANRSVAVTFDDLPATHGGLAEYEYVTENLLSKLKAARVPAIGFVNERKLFVVGEIDRRTALLKRWLDDGHELGNHSFSHIQIDRASFEQYAEDVVRGETVTRMLLDAKGKKLRYYRHTQLRTGPTEEYRKQLNDFLSRRGYITAPVTVDNNDYVYAMAYANAKQRGDMQSAEKIVASYIEYMDKVFDHFEKISVELLGYEVKQTLLLHANELNADHFDKLAAMIRKRGYSFITLDEALADPAYKLPEAISSRGLSWIHRWTIAKGKPMREEPLEPGWLAPLARTN